MRFYNFLKRKAIKQDKKHTEPKQHGERGRWMPTTFRTPTLPSRYSDQRAQIIKN